MKNTPDQLPGATNLTAANDQTLSLACCMPTAVTPSPNVLQVAAMFGLGVDQQRQIPVVKPTQLVLRPGEVVFITGPSGSGKSTLLRLIRQQLADNECVTLIDFNDLPALGDVALVDTLSLTLDDSLRLLSLAGLNDAFVMLRSPSQLSDGQRYRLRLAQIMATVEQRRDDKWCVVLADEFGAALDRVTAKVIAANVRKWTTDKSVCFVAATTHDDLLEELSPDCLIEQHLGAELEMVRR
ncbi:MAG: ATP-binding cassette domain-containing protein [Phycisphaeraceae bacterium]|nr:ATP-binding cassette domain-containing protein [Phycisphaeraceae bacterium]